MSSMIIGITGQTGAGKSYVSNFLIENGYKVINADNLSRVVVEKGKPCLLDIVVEFGIGVLNPNGTLNRKVLAGIVFNNLEKKEKLQNIIFPYIQDEIDNIISNYFSAGEKVVFLDAPTLIESGRNKKCDKVISIIAPSGERYIRIIKRDDITENEANERMNAQHNDDFYIKHSDFIINNSGDFQDLRLSIFEMLEKFGI